MPKTVLVTGVSRYLGGLVAARLAAEPGVRRVIGVDVIPPPRDIGGAEFVRADIRSPLVARVMEDAGVDTVVHAAVIATPTTAGGRGTQKDINVIGTMQLLAACQRVESVQRLVVKSSAAVYGSSSRDPAMFTEDMGPKVTPRSGFGKDSLEVEGYVRGLQRRRPELAILTLRLANVIGPRIRTTMTDYFNLPVVPVPLGYEPRLQFLHEDDAVRVLALGALSTATGAVNVSGEGVITLRQAVALAGKPSLPVPPQAAGLVGGLTKRLGLADFSPDQLGFLVFGRGMDTTRMHTVLGFDPEWTTRTAFEDYLEGRIAS